MRSGVITMRARRSMQAGGVWLVAGSARAHEEAHPSPAVGLEDWTWDPLVMTLIVCACGLYARGLTRMWGRAGSGRGVRGVQALCFALGAGVLVLALLSPLDAVSDLLFSAHMTQHELLMLVAAPLLVLGRPLGPVVGGMPARLRRGVLQWLLARQPARVWRRATGPLMVWILNAVVLWIWHVPFLYEAALASEPVHWVQHASFLGVAALFWSALVQGRYGRAGYGLASLFVFATALQGSILGALITVSPAAWYPSHRARTQAWGLSPVEDQQLAGLILWVPAGVLLAVLALALFAAWLGEVERRTESREAVRSRGARIRPLRP